MEAKLMKEKEDAQADIATLKLQLKKQKKLIQKQQRELRAANHSFLYRCVKFRRKLIQKILSHFRHSNKK